MGNQHSGFGVKTPLGPDNLVKDVLANMRVNSTEWIIQEVDVGIIVDGSRQTDSLLLATTQVDALSNLKKDKIR